MQTKSAPDILKVQEPVQKELSRVQVELANFFVSDIRLINQISRHMLSANGKKLRPTLLLLISGLWDGVEEDSIWSATIVELVHTATLVHDDSIDRSYLRRGLPTVNSVWSDQVATIMGDYLYSKAFFLMVERGLHREMDILARTTHRMSIGEMLELERKKDLETSEEDYLRMIGEKTASLFAAACRIGAIQAVPRSDSEERMALERRFAAFGHSLGMAFQITDDLLDYDGDESAMGKSPGGDLREGKVTLPLIHALREAEPGEGLRIRGEILSEEYDFDAIASFVRRNRGLSYCESLAERYAEAAERELASLPDTSYLTSLRAAVDYSIRRRR